MDYICPYCEDERKVYLIQLDSTFVIKGKPIEIIEFVFRCAKCSKEWWSSELPDTVDIAYRRYQQLYGVYPPDERAIKRKGPNDKEA